MNNAPGNASSIVIRRIAFLMCAVPCYVVPISLAYQFIYQASFRNVTTLDRQLVEWVNVAVYLSVLGLIAALITAGISGKSDATLRLVIASMAGFVIGIMPALVPLYMLPSGISLVFGAVLYVTGPTAFVLSLLLERVRRTPVAA